MYIGNSPADGENNSFKILDNISTFTQTFDGSSSAVVSTSNSTLTFTGHRFITGQRVTYSTTGTTIGGLTSGTVYYIIKTDPNIIQLASSYANAVASTYITLTGLGVGTTHTLNVAFDGVNTRFKATYDNGTKAQITRAAQLQISVNGVIQQPQDTVTPTNGFGIGGDSVIVFSTAPTVSDVFWGNLFANNFPTFDISDNTVDTFTGTGSQTDFVLSKVPANNQNVLVTIDGVVQYPSDATNVRSYSVIQNVLSFVGAPGNGSAIQVRHIGFAGATSSAVTGFYGRTGNVALTSADNVSIGSATISNDSTINGITIGKGSGNDGSNTALGNNALLFNTTGSNNTSIGYQALYSNTTGVSNTAVGVETLFYNTIGTNNTSIGLQALKSNTTGSQNTATGRSALFSNTTGIQNTANGIYSLYNNTTGSYNTANGYRALFSNTTAATNTAIGHNSLYFNTTGSQNTATGLNALYANTIGTQNTATGTSALQSNTTGTQNTANGYQALFSNTTGIQNTATGYTALYSNTTGSSNVANGFQALLYNTTGNNNTADGTFSLNANTTGLNNTATGYEALRSNTTGNNNTAIGSYTLVSNTIGYHNTATGTFSLNANTTGIKNTATGFGALQLNTTGSINTANGYNSLYSNTTGTQNTANGVTALQANTTGYNNTATGHQALNYNTIGYSNIATGTNALYSNTTGYSNTAIGQQALFSNTTGSNNTATGVSALYSNTTGTNNVCYGYQAGYNLTTGSNNTIIGAIQGTAGLSDTVIIGAGTAERLRIDSSGNTGIGTNNPARKLDVVDSGASGSVIRSKVTTNNGGYLAYEALNSSGTSVFSVNHNGGITLAGNVIFASGQGLDFSATANSSGTMTSELLNDYEEGTWSPSIYGTTTAGTTTYFQRAGTYTKVGRVVTVQVFVTITNQTGTGALRLGNLPFTAGSGANTFPCAVKIGDLALFASHYPVFSVAGGTTYINMEQTPVGGGAIYGIAIDTAFNVELTATYFV